MPILVTTVGSYGSEWQLGRRRRVLLRLALDLGIDDVHGRILSRRAGVQEEENPPPNPAVLPSSWSACVRQPRQAGVAASPGKNGYLAVSAVSCRQRDPSTATRLPSHPRPLGATSQTSASRPPMGCQLEPLPGRGRVLRRHRGAAGRFCPAGGSSLPVGACLAATGAVEPLSTAELFSTARSAGAASSREALATEEGWQRLCRPSRPGSRLSSRCSARSAARTSTRRWQGF